MREAGGRTFPRLYPILDAELLLREVADDRERRQALLRRTVAELARAGVEILQYRNKRDVDALVEDDARAILESACPMRLILNDRAHLVGNLGWHGVHLGQHDMVPSEARRLVGDQAWVGISTHNESQVRAANLEPVDYIAVGPVFTTSTRANPDPVIGLEGVRRARALTGKPLVAIGGITPETAPAAIDAGANSVAVIAAIFAPGRSAGQAARDILVVFK